MQSASDARYSKTFRPVYLEDIFRRWAELKFSAFPKNWNVILRRHTCKNYPVIKKVLIIPAKPTAKPHFSIDVFEGVTENLG